MHRHPEISVRKATAKSAKRLKNMAAKINHWIKLLEHLEKAGYLQDASGIWNFDESPFKLAELNETVFARKGVKNVSISTEGTDWEHVTLLAGGNAFGHMLRPPVLYSGSCHLKSRLIGTQDSCWVGVNQTGVMDYAVWNEYMEKEAIPALSVKKVFYFR